MSEVLTIWVELFSYRALVSFWMPAHLVVDGTVERNHFYRTVKQFREENKDSQTEKLMKEWFEFEIECSEGWSLSKIKELVGLLRKLAYNTDFALLYAERNPEYAASRLKSPSLKAQEVICKHDARLFLQILNPHPKIVKKYSYVVDLTDAGVLA